MASPALPPRAVCRHGVDLAAESSDEVDRRIRVVLLTCFDSEAGIIEHYALAWLHANCPRIRVMLNLSKPPPTIRLARPAAAALAMSGIAAAPYPPPPPPVSASYQRVITDFDGGPPILILQLNVAKLADVLLPKSLLTARVCGAPRFTAAVIEQYTRLGLPRSLLSVISYRCWMVRALMPTDRAAQLAV